MRSLEEKVRVTHGLAASYHFHLIVYNMCTHVHLGNLPVPLQHTHTKPSFQIPIYSRIHLQTFFFFTFLKCTVYWVLVYSQSYTTSPLSNFRILSSPPKKTHINQQSLLITPRGGWPTQWSLEGILAEHLLHLLHMASTSFLQISISSLVSFFNHLNVPQKDHKFKVSQTELIFLLRPVPPPIFPILMHRTTICLVIQDRNFHTCKHLFINICIQCTFIECLYRSYNLKCLLYHKGQKFDCEQLSICIIKAIYVLKGFFSLNTLQVQQNSLPTMIIAIFDISQVLCKRDTENAILKEDMRFSPQRADGHIGGDKQEK